MNVWQVHMAGYKYRDEEENERWTPLDGEPLFESALMASEAARVSGRAHPESRAITVWKSVKDWKEDRQQNVRKQAIRKIWGMLTEEERKVLGL